MLTDFSYPLSSPPAIGGAPRPTHGGGLRPPSASRDVNRTASPPAGVPITFSATVAFTYGAGTGTALGDGVRQPRMPPSDRSHLLRTHMPEWLHHNGHKNTTAIGQR